MAFAMAAWFARRPGTGLPEVAVKTGASIIYIGLGAIR
jgi:hypothetical protein